MHWPPPRRRRFLLTERTLSSLNCKAKAPDRPTDRPTEKVINKSSGVRVEVEVEAERVPAYRVRVQPTIDVGDRAKCWDDVGKPKLFIAIQSVVLFIRLQSVVYAARG